MEMFDMGLEEAIAETKLQFETERVDLTNIVLTGAGVRKGGSSDGSATGDGGDEESKASENEEGKRTDSSAGIPVSHPIVGTVDELVRVSFRWAGLDCPGREARLPLGAAQAAREAVADLLPPEIAEAISAEMPPGAPAEALASTEASAGAAASAGSSGAAEARPHGSAAAATSGPRVEELCAEIHAALDSVTAEVTKAAGADAAKTKSEGAGAGAGAGASAEGGAAKGGAADAAAPAGSEGAGAPGVTSEEEGSAAEAAADGARARQLLIALAGERGAMVALQRAAFAGRRDGCAGARRAALRTAARLAQLPDVCGSSPMAFLEEVQEALKAGDGHEARSSILLTTRFVHKSEFAKRQAFELGVIRSALELLRSEGTKDSESKGKLAGLIATLVRGCITHDDLSAPKTRCFDNARELGGDGTTVTLFFDCIKAHMKRPRALEPLLDCVRSLAVNNEICEDMEDQGVLRDIFVASVQAQVEDPGVSRAASAMVKQLANADSNKRKAMRKECAPFKALMAILAKHRDAP